MTATEARQLITGFKFIMACETFDQANTYVQQHSIEVPNGSLFKIGNRIYAIVFSEGDYCWEPLQLTIKIDEWIEKSVEYISNTLYEYFLMLGDTPGQYTGKIAATEIIDPDTCGTIIMPEVGFTASTFVTTDMANRMSFMINLEAEQLDLFEYTGADIYGYRKENAYSAFLYTEDDELVTIPIKLNSSADILSVVRAVMKHLCVKANLVHTIAQYYKM